MGFPSMASSYMGMGMPSMGYMGMGMPSMDLGMGMAGMNMPGMAMPSMGMPGMGMPGMSAAGGAGYGASGYGAAGYGMPSYGAAGYPPVGYGAPSYPPAPGYGPPPGYNPGVPGNGSVGYGGTDAGGSAGSTREREPHGPRAPDRDRGSTSAGATGAARSTANSEPERSKGRTGSAAAPLGGPGKLPVASGTAPAAGGVSGANLAIPTGTQPAGGTTGSLLDGTTIGKLVSAAVGQGGVGTAAVTPAKVKAMIPCRYQMRKPGSCTNGDSCAFSHDPELIAKASATAAAPSSELRGGLTPENLKIIEEAKKIAALAKLLPVAASAPVTAALLKLSTEGPKLLAPKPVVAAPRPIIVAPKVIAPKVIGPTACQLVPMVPMQSKSSGAPMPVAVAALPKMVLPRVVAPKLVSPPALALGLTAPAPPPPAVRPEPCKLFPQGLCWKGATCPYLHEGAPPVGLDLGPLLSALSCGDTGHFSKASTKASALGVVDLTGRADDSSAPAPAGCQPKAKGPLEAPSAPSVLKPLDSTPAVLHALDACVAAAMSSKAAPPVPLLGVATAPAVPSEPLAVPRAAEPAQATPAAPPPSEVAAQAVPGEPVKAAAAEAAATAKAPPQQPLDALPQTSPQASGAGTTVPEADEKLGGLADPYRVSFGWQRITPKAAGGSWAQTSPAPPEPPVASGVSAAAGMTTLEPVNMEDL